MQPLKAVRSDGNQTAGRSYLWNVVSEKQAARGPM
jgi:hypothetical protein